MIATAINTDDNHHHVDVAKLEDICFAEVNSDGTTDEWRNVPIVIGRLDSSVLSSPRDDDSHRSRVLVTQKSELITFEKLTECLFDRIKLDARPKKPEISKSKIERLERLIFGPPGLKDELKPCRDLIIGMAATSFDDSDQIHLGILKTIYVRLTNSSVYHRYGSHWETVGFQGNDPATDLRGCGILSLVLILYTLEPAASFANLIEEIYKLSHHDTQHFPFCLVGINLSGLVLDAIHKGHLNSCLNKIKTRHNYSSSNWVTATDECVALCGKCFLALFLEFYLDWKLNGKTIEEFGFVLKDLEKKMKKSAKVLLKKLDDYLLRSTDSQELEGGDDLLVKFNSSLEKKKNFNAKKKKEKKSNDKTGQELEFTKL